jgi:hypothetical protein
MSGNRGAFSSLAAEERAYLDGVKRQKFFLFSVRTHLRTFTEMETAYCGASVAIKRLTEITRVIYGHLPADTCCACRTALEALCAEIA